MATEPISSPIASIARAVSADGFATVAGQLDAELERLATIAQSRAQHPALPVYLANNFMLPYFRLLSEVGKLTEEIATYCDKIINNHPDYVG
jgi:hypothetical protein